MDPSLELQGKVVEALRAAGVAGGRVYDAIPSEKQRKSQTGKEWPVVSLGPWTSTPDDADGIRAEEISAQLDVWSREPGFVEVRQVARAIKVALRSALALSNNGLVLLEHDVTRVMRDPDGLTSRAALTFTAVIEEP